MTDLEREAREAARLAFGDCAGRYVLNEEKWREGYLAAAAPREQELRRLRLLAEEQLTTLRKLKAEMLSDTRDQEIERLRAELAKVTEQRDAWPKYHGTAVEGLMILHDRKDLQDLAGLRCGDFMANAVPHIVAEIDRLRAREKLWSEYVALMVESEKLTITMFHVHGGRFPVEMIERGKRLRYALGLE